MTIRDCVQSFRDANRDVCVGGRKAFSTVQMFRADAGKRHESAKRKLAFARFRCASARKIRATAMTIRGFVCACCVAKAKVCVGGRKSFSTVQMFRADAGKRHEGANRPAPKMNSRCDYMRAAHAGLKLKLVCMRMFSAHYIIVVAGGRIFRAISAKLCATAMTIHGFVCACCVNEIKICVGGRESFEIVHIFRADASKRHEGAKKKGLSPFSCCAADD